MARKSKIDAHLLVEGKNDFHVISALCAKYDVPESFDIRWPKNKMSDGGGRDQLLKLFRFQLEASDKKAIGIVLDADDDLMARWQQVLAVIEKVNSDYVLPSQPEPNGLIIPAPYDYKPRLGIWLMPDNQNRGELEDFVRYLVPDSDQLHPYADEVLNQIETAKLNHYKHKRSKAFIHTWLAWQKEPGLPMGAAITAKALSADSPMALQFVNWLNRLFNPARTIAS